MNQWIYLASRTILSLGGKDTLPFLHGLVTQNLLQCQPAFTALLTPQGRFHSDFFVIPQQDRVLLDCDQKHRSSIMEILGKFKMFHDITLEDRSHEYAVCSALGPQVMAFLNLKNALEQDKNGILYYQDPRVPVMGVRAIVPYVHLPVLPHSLLVPSQEGNYHYHRILHIVPEGASDLIVDKSIILEYGYHHLGAICWEKGCYLGQELMAKTFHRGEIRKQPYGLRILYGSFPPLGAELFHGAEKLGIMGSHCKNLGLASLYSSKIQSVASREPLSLKWNVHTFVVSLTEMDVSRSVA